MFGRKRHNCTTESAKLNVLRSTTSSLQQLHAREAAAEPGAVEASRCCSALIVPPQLLPEERAAALALVQKCPHLAQALLDELSARLAVNAVHTSPIAYLRALVERAHAGTFVPQFGLRVAAARRRHQEDRVLREQREADAQRLAAESATPEYQQKVAARKAQVRQMLDAMRSGRGKKP